MKYRLKAADGSARRPHASRTPGRGSRARRRPPSRSATRARWAKALRRGDGRLRLPAGRAASWPAPAPGRDVTLFNCFVMGRIEDDLGSIFDNVKEAALTMQQGGGIGHDFSTLRPKGALVKSIGADASGPVSFMDVWDAMCRTIMSAGARRGAMMATLRCDHPDIEAFIDAKARRRAPAQVQSLGAGDRRLHRARCATTRPGSWSFGGKVYRTVPARALWDRIMRATYDYAEPGVIFIDRINAREQPRLLRDDQRDQSVRARRHLGAHGRRPAPGAAIWSGSAFAPGSTGRITPAAPMASSRTGRKRLVRLADGRRLCAAADRRSSASGASRG